MQPLPYSTGCFVCGDVNPFGLRLRFFHRDGWVVGSTSLPTHYRGFLDRAHGGILSALVDEAMGWATVLEGNRFSYTVELKLRFRQPVELETPLEIRGRVVRHTRRLSFTEGEIRNARREPLVTAEGKFILLSESETQDIADTLIYSPDSWRVSPR